YGSFLGGNSLIANLARSTIIGQLSHLVAGALVGQDLTQSVVGSSAGNTAIDQSAGAATSVSRVQKGANTLVSSLLMTEAAHALGLSGFAGTVFTVTGNAITAQLLTNVENIAVKAGGDAGLGAATIGDLFAGFDKIQFANNLGGALGGALGSFIGS